MTHAGAVRAGDRGIPGLHCIGHLLLVPSRPRAEPQAMYAEKHEMPFIRCANAALWWLLVKT